MEYSLTSTLLDEVSNEVELHPQINQLINVFVRYLKEPKYQQPLQIDELSTIFHQFYRDLNCLIINFYTNSNSIKKQLIKSSKFFNENDSIFDYLLAIANSKNNGNGKGNGTTGTGANGSNGSGKLIKRYDSYALHQSRIFNYYKFIIIFQSIELAQKKLFNTLLHDLTLYDKVFKFEQRDIIHEEFLYEKIDLLKLENLNFDKFGNEKFATFINQLTSSQLNDLESLFISLDSCHSPFSKLLFIVKIHKVLIQFCLDSGYKNQEINNDILLPLLIYIIIYKIKTRNIYSNFLFIKHFSNIINPYNIELYNINLSNYQPQEKINKIGNKYRLTNLFDLLLIDDTQNEKLNLDEKFQFFTNDHDLINYLSNNYLNNGELNYYLTNFEAVIMFLSNITLQELDHEKSSHNLLNFTLFDLVEQDLQNHFKFPEIETEKDIDKEKEKEKEKDKKDRSRSSSILNSLTNKFHENRTRSNSSIMNSNKSSSKESFPTLATSNDLESVNSPDDNSLSVSIVKNLLGRFNSISVSQFNHYEKNENDVNPGINSSDDNDISNSDATNGNDVTTHDSNTVDSNSIYSHTNSLSSHTNSIHLTPKVISSNKSLSFINRISPIHTRTRSSSLEQGKRNSITNKLTNGVNEFMIKLNSSSINSPSTLNNSRTTNSSVESLDEAGDSTLTLKPDYNRSRNTSLQIMDKWFSNISANLHHSNPKSKDLLELIKYKDVEFDNLSIKDLKLLKHYYDILCQQSLQFEKDIDTAEQTIINESNLHSNGIGLGD